MKRLGYHSLALLATLALVLGFATQALAQTPNVNGVIFELYRFNDCPAGTANSGGTYPTSIYINDPTLLCTGFANAHVWRFSSDGGATAAVFHNNSNFHACADLVIDGIDNNGAEAGLNIPPWWDGSQTDGRMNVRTSDGEIACFGGRMPFYSFTGTNGIHYVKGTLIHLEMTYLAHHNTQADPGTIDYKVVYNSNTYDSGPLPFDQGTAAEDPPHGLWGILNDTTVGGFFQVRLDPGNAAANMTATWSNICYDNLQVTPTQSSTWGRLKSLYR